MVDLYIDYEDSKEKEMTQKEINPVKVNLLCDEDIKIMEELQKQAGILAKLDNKISTLENKMHKDYNNLRRKIEKR